MAKPGYTSVTVKNTHLLSVKLHYQKLMIKERKAKAREIMDQLKDLEK